MKKALIICNDFPPLNSIGAERPYSWFKYFKLQGLEVTVITKDWQNPSPDPKNLVYGSYKSTTAKVEQLPEGTIIRVPHRLIWPDRLLVKYGAGKYSAFRKGLTFFYKMLSFLFPFFDKHYNLYLAAEELLSKEKMDVVITTGEPFVLFKYGYELRKKFNVKWVADFRDKWFLNHESNKSTFFLNRFLLQYEYQFEKKYMRAADLIQTVNPEWMKDLAALHPGKKYAVAQNGFWQFYQPTSPPNSEKSLLLTHTGTLTSGQRIEILLDAIRELHQEKKIAAGDIKLTMVGLENFANQLARVRNYLPELDGYLFTTPRIPKQEAMQANYNSDYCIALTDPASTGIYAKIYDYIASGTPILLIPTDHLMMEEIVHSLGAGKTIETKEELKTFLLEQVNNKKQGIAPAKTSLDKGKAWQYSREAQSQKAVNNILSILD